jgi:type IV fimbrial biogenesis protein FimT
MNIRSRRERGVTIVELLVVVGIIGIMLLVATPNFFTYYRANQLRTSMRQFNTDVRAARQRAVTRNLRTRVTFSTGATSRVYHIYEWNETADDWDLVTKRELQQIVHFESTNFTDTEGGDSRPDIVFRTNGTISPYPANGEVVLLANANIPKNQWTISFQEAGNLSAVSN